MYLVHSFFKPYLKISPNAMFALGAPVKRKAIRRRRFKRLKTSPALLFA